MMKQEEVIAFLSDDAAYGAAVGLAGRIKTIKTHISTVFLVGGRAFKLKHDVKFPYLDFSSLDNRRRACEKEVALNRRTAPELYLGLRRVVADKNGGLSLRDSGAGADQAGDETVEWLIEMQRFDQDQLFDHLAERDALHRELMEDLAGSIYQFHEDAKVAKDCGGWQAMAAIIDNNAESFVRFGGDLFDPEKIKKLNTLSRQNLEIVGPQFDQRRDDGKVRHCHGDLHLRNIVLLNDRPTLFDAIEFSETFSVIDIAYDLAFLLMDLINRGFGKRANNLLNRYLDLSGDMELLALLPLMLSMRAAIRAHVAAASISDRDDNLAGLKAEARQYLDLALDLLVTESPRLVAVGGLSGTGKSKLARHLAPLFGTAPGAVVIRSDAVRKRCFGTPLEQSLPPQGYSREMSELTYKTVLEDVRAALRAGHSVIADAVFAKPPERQAIAAIAEEEGVPFEGLWLDLPLEIREERVTNRVNNISDADVDVVRRQSEYDLGTLYWRRIDASGPRKMTRQKAINVLGLG